MVTQAMVVGTALPNFFSILVQKHPSLPSSLVNFNLVYILIPCSLLGSTFGSILAGFTPEIVQDVLIIIVFSYFVKIFYFKFRNAQSKEK